MLKKSEERIMADMVGEDVGHKPINYGSVEKNIIALKERIAYLKKRLKNIHPDAKDSDAEVQLIRDINGAQIRLREFQAQLKGRN